MARLGVQGRRGPGNSASLTGEEYLALAASAAIPSSSTPGSPDYVERNRAAWERWAPGLAPRGKQDWSASELHWGLWYTAESSLGLLDDIGTRADVIELGCGTAAISGWLARQDLRPVAVDFSHRQIESARSLQEEFDVSFPLVHSNVERVPFDLESFDVAVSEYGASLWCEPERWLPEASRLLRPGGRLIFIANSATLMACTFPEWGPAGEHLIRESFGDERMEFQEDDTVEFHLTHGRWISMLRSVGLEIEDLIEVRPSPSATPRYELVSTDWARKWPSEEIWIARKADTRRSRRRS